MYKRLGRKVLMFMMAILVAIGTFTLPSGANAELINGWVFTAEDENGNPLTEGKIYVYEKSYATYVDQYAKDYQVNLIFNEPIQNGEFFVPNAYLLTGKEYQVVVMSYTTDGTPIIYHSDFTPGSGKAPDFSSDTLLHRHFITNHAPEYGELNLDFIDFEGYSTWPILLPIVSGAASVYISATSDIQVSGGFLRGDINAGYMFREVVSPSDSPIAGNERNEFAPREQATRAEAASMLQRLIHVLDQ